MFQRFLVEDELKRKKRERERKEKLASFVVIHVVRCTAFCCRRYGTKCSGCLQGISPQDLVRKARDKVFHLNCFTCLVCRKQMSTGEELYVLDDNKFVCKQDYLSGKPLPDTHHVHGHHGELQVSLSLVIHREEKHHREAETIRVSLCSVRLPGIRFAELYWYCRLAACYRLYTRSFVL